jgi:hypothetical protein
MSMFRRLLLQVSKTIEMNARMVADEQNRSFSWRKIGSVALLRFFTEQKGMGMLNVAYLFDGSKPIKKGSHQGGIYSYLYIDLYSN